MKVNFEIEENYAVKYNGFHIDLHNNFDFIGITDLNQHDTILEFQKTKGDWVNKNEFEYLTFKFINITYRFIKKGDAQDYSEDSKCLGELTFFPSEFRDTNDSIIPQTTPNEDDDIIFFFEDGRLIRLNSEYVELITKK